MSTAKPPDIKTSDVRPSTSGTNATHIKHSRTKRSLPHWMDTENQYGDVEYLLLQGINNTALPRKPFVIEKSVQIAAEGPIAGAISESRGSKYTLEVCNKRQVEKLLKLTKLIDDSEVEVIYHPTRNVSRCVITCWDFADTDINEIQESLKDQGVTNVRKITRQTEKGTVNTGTMILTIRGTICPNYVKLGLLRIPTRKYYPAPMLCFKCLSYGHTKIRCTGDEKCQNCAGKHNLGETCDRSSNCNNCKQNHISTSKTCPIYQKEWEIVRIKVDENLSYGAARQAYQSRVTTSKGTYAENVQQTNTTINKEMAELKEMLKQKEEEKTALLAENKKLQREISNLHQTLNKVLQNQETLQQQLKERFESPKVLVRREPLDNVAIMRSVPENIEEPRMKTRSKTNKKTSHKIVTTFSCSDIEKQNDNNKRPVSSPTKKPPKIHKLLSQNSQDLLSDSTMEETESEIEVAHRS